MRGRNDHSLGRPGFFFLAPFTGLRRIAFLFKALRNEKEIESYVVVLLRLYKKKPRGSNQKIYFSLE